MTTEVVGTAKGAGQPWIPAADTFGARLALVRQHMAWGNIVEAATACTLPVASWRNWERDGRSPRNIVEISRKIAARTGCDFLWLLTGSASVVKLGTTSQYPQVSDVHPALPANIRPPTRADAVTRPPTRVPTPRRPALLRGNPSG